MFKHLSVLLVRKKGGGLQSWTPKNVAAGVTPSDAVSGSELIRLMYRPLPLNSTVEYEEDFGPSLMLHREFIPRRLRERLSFADAPLVYSDVELHKAKQQLAEQANRERQGAAITKDKNTPAFETNVDPDTREVLSARFLFDNKRMEYCHRFDGAIGQGRNELFSLMEACAVIYGYDDAETREAYFRIFLSLDRRSLDDDAERVYALRADRDDVAKMLEEVEGDEGGAATEAAVSLPDEFLEYAPLVKSYLAHASGKTPTISTDVSSLGMPGAVAERQRWRRLMDKLIAEEYHMLTDMERADAEVLNEQLNSIKLFDLRVGDVVREMVQISRRAQGSGGSMHGGTLEMSPGNPERRLPRTLD